MTATLTDLPFKYTNPSATLTFSALRNGTRTLTGNAQGAALSNQVTVVRSAPGRQDASVTHNLLLSFTPATGQSLVVRRSRCRTGRSRGPGTFTWTRGGVSRTFTVTTVTPLVWDSSLHHRPEDRGGRDARDAGGRELHQDGVDGVWGGSDADLRAGGLKWRCAGEARSTANERRARPAYSYLGSESP